MQEGLRAPGARLDADVTEQETASALRDGIVTASEQTCIVGIGGSTGGLQALQRFFEKMPANTGMSFVVVLHLSPDFASSLSEILQRSTAMSVAQAVDGAVVLPNHVYVIPPGRHLTLHEGRLRLSDLPREPGRRRTVDLFFRSLADTLGVDAIAIVLSGTDGDGAMGIKRVKERGGLTIAQDPAGAEAAGMPRAAIATSMVDWVLSAEEMPPRVLEYRSRACRIALPLDTGLSPRLAEPAVETDPSKADEESALRDVLAFLRARTGSDFSCYKRATIVRRVARRVAVNEVENLTGYLKFLRTHPGEAGALLQDLLISVTNFFRDSEAFEALEGIVPELFKHKTAADTVRVWVPACATGEEAYSIAILLSEHARTLSNPPSIQIFATDLNEDVLAEARNAVYPDAIETDVSPERLQRYLVKKPHGYRVRSELRELVLFAAHDLLRDSPFSRLDLVSCRNLLIYLNRSAQQRAFSVFHFALANEGKLFLGASESPEDANGLFCALDKKHRIYAARPVARASLPLPAGQSALSRTLSLQDREIRLPAAASGLVPVALTSPSAGDAPRLASSELHLKLIELLGPATLVVDAEHEIVHLTRGAAALLQFPGGEPSSNLLRVIHPALRRELRSALFRAKQTAHVAVVEALPIELGGQPQMVTIRVSLTPELAGDYFLVAFELRPTAAIPPAPAPGVDDSLYRQLEGELEQTKQHARDLIEQHEASMEEQQAGNEELQAMNEELRSASEELETSREELQSINEELTTVNQELKTRIEELGQTNSDLQNFMGATAIPTVFLDRDLRIMRFTPHAVDLFSLIPTDLGRPLGNLQHRLLYPELLSDAAGVLAQLTTIEREVPALGGKVFLVRILPYRTTDDRIAGVVMTFVDVSERHAAQVALRRMHQELEDRVRERTAQLDSLNVALKSEILEHRRAEQARQELQNRLVVAQEEERGRISRELHDEVGQQMSALLIGLKALELASPTEEMPQKLRSLRAIVDHVAQEVHQLAYELRPVTLDELGLAGALAGYLEDWSKRTGLPVDFVTSGMDASRLPAPIETTLYRIVQEAMNNVYKHASAHGVSVTVERRSGYVLAMVEDDGRGFDTARLDGAITRQIGIVGMRERALVVGGELTLESSEGHGTTLRAKLPLPLP